jgi:flagellar biosynthesis chaperone FliJ
VSSAWLSAAIQEFEQVSLDNGTELLRIRARAQRGDDPEPRPVLVTREQDGTTHVYEPLSSGGDRRGLMRLAFTVPSGHVGPSTAFSLRLPDGYRIELPEPTPGENRAEPEDGQQWEDVQPWDDAPSESERGTAAEHTDGARGRIAELEREVGQLRSAGSELQRRLAELTAERDEALETTREQLAEHARLTARLRQLQARIELLRADATDAASGIDPRRRQLESEREQLATHIRALADLLLTDERVEDAAEGGGGVVDGVADRLEAIRAQAVREANEHAERELRRLRAGAPL